jgi:hypothetical protein
MALVRLEPTFSVFVREKAVHVLKGTTTVPCNLYLKQHIILLITSMRLEWVGHVTYVWEKKISDIILVSKSEKGKNQLGDK